MNNKVDLHIHTTMSDGTFSPTEIIYMAIEKGIEYISITDHDTMNGVQEATAEGLKNGITVISGIEISSGYKGKDIHVLGYGMNPYDPKLESVFNYVQKDRKNRNIKIAKKMIKDGIPIDLEIINSKEIFGRPHFAQILIDNGIVSSISEAFDTYLSQGCRYFEPRSYMPIETVIQTIHDCGGKAILAHPYQYKFSEIEFYRFLEDVFDYGMDGLEVYYTGYTSQQIECLLKYAEDKDLLVTGGSDFHGDNKPQIQLGNLYVPIYCARKLKSVE